MSTSAASGRGVAPRTGRDEKIPGGGRHEGSSEPDSASRMARHTRSGVHGMSMWRTPRWLSASTTAFCTAGVEPMVPDSPMPLAPSGLSWAGGLGVGRLERRELGRAGHGVVGQRRRQRVAVGVVDELLPQRLGHPLGDPAVLLAGDDQRVEDAAAVVDRDVAQGPDPARLGVDLDHRHVGAEGEGGARPG